MKRIVFFILIVLSALLLIFLFAALFQMTETDESEIDPNSPPVPEFKDHIIQSGLFGPLYVSTIDLDQDSDNDILATIFHEN
ncbi:MAG: hypothetical protein ACFFBQ_19345, partial [Promethearchaeota archaeon]